ncbi:hypothetical protein Patl1_04716 [Pistacia atlantica]|uniref:Uncharacterized protein n=1 Tax=Pistacia atlantica TaxID=434234 RepID=A0ACC1BU99_9ROSI|nr:hypothetical protein Patl1_04716 [Pistacia atlantica]
MVCHCSSLCRYFNSLFLSFQPRYSPVCSSLEAFLSSFSHFELEIASYAAKKDCHCQ